MITETYYHPKNDGHAYRCALNAVSDYFQQKPVNGETDEPAVALHLETVDGYNIAMTDILPTDRFVIQTLARHHSFESIRFGFRDGLGEIHRLEFTQDRLLDILNNETTIFE